MKVLVLHNSYRMHGGEDVVVDAETELLRKNKNDITIYKIGNDDISGAISKIFTALGCLFSIKNYFSVRHLIRDIKPDIVHVHNFFPRLSPSVFFACRHEGVPAVLTLHNYRIICPTALLMFDGKPTDRSIRSGPWWTLRQRVYRDSYVGTFMLCLMISLHKIIGTWRSKVNGFIVMTEFAKRKFESAGIPGDKISVKPNFVDIPNNKTGINGCHNKSGIMFVGRLSYEKGIQTFIEAANIIGQSERISDSDKLSVLGDGPMQELVSECRDVVWYGNRERTFVQAQMSTKIALVIPSICYEGFPMALVEGYASGLPIIASRIGALAELVEEGVTGLFFEPGNARDLANKIEWAVHNPEKMMEMGRLCRTRYEDHYHGGENYRQLVAIYRKYINKRWQG